MAQTWEEVYAGIKTEMLAKIKTAYDSADWSGGIGKDISQALKLALAVAKVIISYSDSYSGLDREGRRNLFKQAFDDAIKIPGVVGAFVEAIDGTIGGEVFDLLEEATA